MENKILCALLNCGHLDLKFIDRILDDFMIDPDDVVNYVSDNFCGEKIDANTLIYSIFEIAVINCTVELNIDDFDFVNVNIFCNCLDSHLCLKDIDNKYVEIYDNIELKEFITKNYINTAEVA
ncbi:MAG: hypothetical protein LBJ32_04010 [Oscillospiraceae bacterium]|jgi:hypothetical protein|nr:hypothetical protein [Oscillospiraceae bacterium]